MGIFDAIGKGLSAVGIGGDTTSTSTQTSALDPASQAFQDESRRQADAAAQTALDPNAQFFLGADPRSVQEQIQPFMDPFQQQVIDASAREFDVLRERAVGGAGGTNQQAIRAGAQGGSRQGVAEGLRLSELDRAQTTQTAGLLSQNFQQAVASGIPFADRQRQLAQQQAQEPLFKAQQAANFRNMGLGPTGSTQTTTDVQEGSIFRDLAGIGQIGLGLFGGGVPGIPGQPAPRPVNFAQPPLPTFSNQGFNTPIVQPQLPPLRTR